MADQEQGFVVRDRRGSGGSDSPSGSAESTKGAASSASASPVAPSQESPATPVTFASFVISLGSSSLMLMGEQLDPHQAPMPVNLPQAKEIIDILSLLETKTKGNLTADEQSVLTDMLYALRMKFVELTSAGSGSSPR